MTLNEVINDYGNSVTSIEIYNHRFPNDTRLHTDNLRDNYDNGTVIAEDTEVLNYEIMDENDYNSTILANTGVTLDFDDVYGNKDATVLCILI